MTDMTDQAPLRVFLVDDHAMFRAGVRAELGAYVDVVGEASTVSQAVSAIGATVPDVVLLLARGYAYKEIAKELYISIKTVETHVSNVLRKLQMSNRYELSRWAADRRLV